MALVLNGRCLHRPVTGVERYALQLQAALARTGLPLRTITTRHAHGIAGHAWEQLLLPARLRRGDLLIGPANTGPWSVRDQVLVVHDLAWHHHPQWFTGPFGAWYRWLIPALLPRVRGILTVSGTVAGELAGRFPRTAGRIHVVPPAAAAHPAPPAAPDAPPFFLFVGPADPRKDVATFQRAFALLREQHPQARAVVVGGAGRVFARPHHAPGPNESWTGRVDDAALRDLMRRATALVMPSLYEGFGLPVLEAMACGCPAITSDIAVFRDVYGEAVLRVPAGDAATLAHAMTRLADDPRLRTTLVQRGAACRARFSLEAQDAALRRALEALAPELFG